MKHVRQMFAYPDSATGVIQTHFLLALLVSIRRTQDLSPKGIICFLVVYKYLMHCFIVFPFYLKYLTNAKYMISS